MSLERELLGRAMSLIDYRYAPSEAVAVHREIQELLAQPEQTEQKPLSDETIAKLWGESYSGTTQMVRNFARAIEKAHGIGVGNV